MNWALAVFITVLVIDGSLTRSTDLLTVTPTTTASSPRALKDTFKEIIGLIPKDKITEIAKKHLASDEAFKAAILYMQSEEWTKLIEVIRAKPEWQALKDYLKNFGIDIESFHNCSKSFLDGAKVTLDPLKPAANKKFGPFLKEVLEVIPTGKVLAIFHEKMTKDKELQELLEKISDPKFKKIVDSAIALPEVKKVIKAFQEMDLDLETPIRALYTFLGWSDSSIDKASNIPLL